MDWRAHQLKKKTSSSDRRIGFLSVLFVICTALIILRLFDLQILRGGFYAALAADQHELYQKLFPERGSIYVVEKVGGQQSLYPLVTNQQLMTLYAVPIEIADASDTAGKLFPILGLPPSVDLQEAEKTLYSDIPTSTDPKLAEEIKKARRDAWILEQNNLEIEHLKQQLIKPNTAYSPLRERLTDDQTQAIKALDIKGLGFEQQSYRYYPDKGLGGQLFGFYGYNGDKRQGNYGLEGYFNDILTGQNGEIMSERDALGNIIAIGKNYFKEKVDGADLVLTIDRAVQYKACAELKKSVEEHLATGGSVIVANPNTGAIIAMCGYPDYDPDQYFKAKDIDVFNNPAIFSAYEPGSIYKIITMSAALDSGAVQPDTTYVDKGVLQYGKYFIRNFDQKTYGKQTMTQVLEFSINTGAIFAMNQTTPPVFKEYVDKFGFGQPTGIELDKEMPGDLSNLRKKGQIYPATASFGQGITVTPIQMAMAFAAIVNGGKLMKPLLVSQIIKNGQVQNFYPQEARQVISGETAAKLRGMMVSVVENGHAKKAQMPGFHIGGKTGTAQVPGKNGGYTGDIIGSFEAFLPFNNPQFIILVRVDKPVYGKLGETVAVPVFNGIAKFLVQYYNIPYDYPNDPKLLKQEN